MGICLEIYEVQKLMLENREQLKSQAYIPTEENESEVKILPTYKYQTQMNLWMIFKKIEYR